MAQARVERTPTSFSVGQRWDRFLEISRRQATLDSQEELDKYGVVSHIGGFTVMRLVPGWHLAVSPRDGTEGIATLRHGHYEKDPPVDISDHYSRQLGLQTTTFSIGQPLMARAVIASFSPDRTAPEYFFRAKGLNVYWEFGHPDRGLEQDINIFPRQDSL